MIELSLFLVQYANSRLVVLLKLVFYVDSVLNILVHWTSGGLESVYYYLFKICRKRSV